jgi:hypothetical protein
LVEHRRHAFLVSALDRMRKLCGGILAAVIVASAVAAPLHADGGCPALPEIDKIMAVDVQSRTTQTYSDERALRDFALFSYRNIASDVLNGYGPYLDTLTVFFGSVCVDPEQTRRWIGALLARSGLATDFARRLAVAHSLTTAACPGENQ